MGNVTDRHHGQPVRVRGWMKGWIDMTAAGIAGMDRAQLKAERERRGWSVGTLALKSRISASTLRKIESGRVTKIGPRTLKALADAFNDGAPTPAPIPGKAADITTIDDLVPEPTPVPTPAPAATPAPGVPDWLGSLLTGQLLANMQTETAKFDAIRADVTGKIDKLASADQDIVKKALVDILKTGKREELPALKILIDTSTVQHEQTPLLMAAVRNRIPVWLYGEAGSGKTTAAEIVAKVLELRFAFTSVCPASTKSDFLGYRDAGGSYRSTAFRDTYEHGGVFLIDEIDNGNPAILAVLNSALANGQCSFPDGIISRHDDCVIIAAANTIGRGATAQYVGRNAIDAATLDRFAYIKMDIDENLESAMIGNDWTAKLCNIGRGGNVTADKWLDIVRAARNKCAELGLQHIISPRATIYGAKLAASGVGRDNLLDMLIYKGLRPTDQDKLSAALKAVL